MKDSYPPGRWDPHPERWPPGRSDAAWNQPGLVPHWDNPASLSPSLSYRKQNFVPQRPRSIQIAAALMIVMAGIDVIPSLMSIGGSGIFGLYAVIESAPFTVLWWWMARANRAGEGWARTIATAFFGIGAIGGIGGWLFVLRRVPASDFAAVITGPNGYDLGFNLSVLLLALTTIVLLWTRKSSDYYAAMSG